MKKFKKVTAVLLTIVLIYSIFTTLQVNVAAAKIETEEVGASNPYDPYATWNGAWANCTYWAWQYAYDYDGISLPAWGDAKDWYSGASGTYRCDKTPSAHSIMCTGSGTHGHVAYVTDYNSSTGKVYIKQGGTRNTSDGRSEGEISAFPGDLQGYIHLDFDDKPNCLDFGDSFYAVLGNSDNSKAIGLDESNTLIVCPYKGTNDQKWHFIRQSDGGYKIINVCTDTYLVGDNIASLENEAGHNNKIWYIMKDYSGEKLCLTHYSGETLKWLHPAWESWNDGTQITLNDAESCLNINIVNEFSYVNLGDSFYAMLANQSNNKAIGLDSDNNVRVFPYQGYNDEIWHFIRQNDGGYKVINVLTDTYLVGDNIASLENEAGHNNKIWYIMNGSSGSNLCLTHYSSGELRWLHPAYEYWEDDTQITLNDAESCININIVRGDGNKPESFSIITEEQTINEGNSLKIEWNKSRFANLYNVSIWKDDGEHLVYIKTRNNSFEINDLKAGYYGVYINAENHLGQTEYTSLHFTVIEQPTEPKIISIGDTNIDERIDIRDVTAIQRHLVELEPFNEEQLAVADTNGDGEINIVDATHLQMYLAEYDVQLG